jgi:hypothetical protein
MAIGLVYVILFVREVKKVAETAHRASELISEDIDALRQNVKDKGFSIGAFTNFAKSLVRKNTTHKK